MKLLGDLRSVFGRDEVLPTETILTRLAAIEESPWADLHGKALDARGLARRLRQYDIVSTKVKVDGKALQGYRREHLWDSWARYLPPTPTNTEPVEPTEPGTSKAVDQVPLTGEVPDRTEPRNQAEPASIGLTWEVPQVPQVPLSTGGGSI